MGGALGGRGGARVRQVHSARKYRKAPCVSRKMELWYSRVLAKVNDCGLWLFSSNTA